MNSIQEYNQVIDEIIFILKNLDTAFKKLNNKITSVIEQYRKVLMENINIFYTIEETPSKEVDDTLDVYQHYSTKLAGISDRLYQCTNKLLTLKLTVKKHADVTLSLLRSNKEDGRAPQLDQVYNQISYDFIT